METIHAPGMYVVVGDEFAKRLGYESSVGAMGFIDSVMNALCGVTMMTGAPELIGKQVDIHIQDCILSEMPREHQYAVVVDFNTGNIYYSENVDLVNYAAKCMRHSERREFRNIPFMHEVIDFCNEHLEGTRVAFDCEWSMHSLDDREDAASRPYIETYEAEQASKEVEYKPSIDLLADFKRQMQANTEKKVEQIRAVEIKPYSKNPIAGDWKEYHDENCYCYDCLDEMREEGYSDDDY